MRLFDLSGNRLYLSSGEREAFLRVAARRKPVVHTFCSTLAYAGVRISEALELTPRSVHLDENAISVRSLKKRRDDVYRIIPVPPAYLTTLNTAHDIRSAQSRKKPAQTRLWTWTRQHAYEIVKDVMIEANIADGPHRSPKGLRHAYGIGAITKNVPLNMLCKWMGHADIKTTAIYADAVGPEEQDIAARMWR